MLSKIDSRCEIVQVVASATTVCDRNIVREHFVVGVEIAPRSAEDDLLVNVFLSGQPGVLVVLDHLEVDEPKGKDAEEGGEARRKPARSEFGCSTSFAGSLIHDRLNRVLVADARGMVSRTMLCSEIGIIFR